jgi:hypothetical protein
MLLAFVSQKIYTFVKFTPIKPWFSKEDAMTRRILITAMVCLAALFVLIVSNGMAQQDTPARTPATDVSDQVTLRSNFIPVQGRLTDPNGKPLDGSFDLTFKIYDQYTGGSSLCESNNPGVLVENGLFLSYIDMGGCDAFDGRQLYLGITVENDPEMIPRQFIDNVPYAWSLRPGAVISATMGSNAILHIENWAINGRGLRAYGMSETGVNYGVVGGSRSPDGFAGYFYNTGTGVALKASSTGTAIFADGSIKSSAPTYLWISGNEARAFFQADSTIIEMNDHGGSRIQRGANLGFKNIVLPVTIAGTMYGQNVKLTAIDVYWQGDTNSESIRTVRMRRQTGACPTCYAEILADTTGYGCPDSLNPLGCVIHDSLTNHNILSPSSGILYLTLELSFGSETSWIDFGGARLTLEYTD